MTCFCHKSNQNFSTSISSEKTSGFLEGIRQVSILVKEKQIEFDNFFPLLLTRIFETLKKNFGFRPSVTLQRCWWSHDVPQPPCSSHLHLSLRQIGNSFDDLALYFDWKLFQPWILLLRWFSTLHSDSKIRKKSANTFRGKISLMFGWNVKKLLFLMNMALIVIGQSD